MTMTDEEIAIINDPAYQRKVHLTFVNPNDESGESDIFIGNSQIYSEQFRYEEALFDGGNAVFGNISIPLLEVKVADLEQDVTGWELEVIMYFVLDGKTEYEWGVGIFDVVKCDRANDKRYTLISAQGQAGRYNYDISGKDYTNNGSYSLSGVADEVVWGNPDPNVHPPRFENPSALDFESIETGETFKPKKFAPSSLTGTQLLEMVCELRGKFLVPIHGDKSKRRYCKFISLPRSLYSFSGEITEALENNPLCINEYRNLKFDEGIVRGISYNGVSVAAFDDDTQVGTTSYAEMQEEYPGYGYQYKVENNPLTIGLKRKPSTMPGVIEDDLTQIATDIHDANAVNYYLPCEVTIQNGLQYELGDFVTIKNSKGTVGGMYVHKKVIQGIYNMQTTLYCTADKSVVVQTSNRSSNESLKSDAINESVNSKLDPILDKVNALGTTLTKYSTTAKAISQSAWVDTNSSLELSKGVWMVTGTVIFASAANGRRGARFKLASSGGVDQGSQVVPAASTAATYYLTTSWITTVATESDTITLQAYQSTSASLNATSTYLKAVKIA